ncbi:MAG: hypothetical protein NC182_01625 [Prevotella sp.]|nr:hypothetical protein [Staphylococcus sp.]MCM1349882.1 hypothetical protein [Prevotella sp.]
MAQNEIRIPVTIEFNAQASGTPQNGAKQQSSISKGEATGRGISATFFVQAGQKLIAASGNTQLSKGIGDVMKYGSLVARSFTFDFTAIAALALELSSEAIKKINELKQEAQVNNQIKYNQIKSGRLFLGSGETTVTTDWLGNRFYKTK